MWDSDFKDEKPKTWDKMLELSEILSQGFNHVRVDFTVLMIRYTLEK